MNRIATILLLAAVWVGLTGVLSLPNLAVGIAIGWLVLIPALRRGPGVGGQGGPGAGPGAQAPRRWRLVRLHRLPGFGLFFLGQLVLSSLRIARDTIAPRPRLRPGILAVPLDAESDGEIAALATLVTLTPGTLALDLSDDRRTLYVHAAYLEDPEQAKREIKHGFERRILELTR